MTIFVLQKANEFTTLQPEYLVVGEPTELKFATIQKGALKVIVRCKGRAGHSGYPSEGESAIHKLIPVLNDVLNYKWPSDDTYGYSTDIVMKFFHLFFLPTWERLLKVLPAEFERVNYFSSLTKT
ncbi:hypothetical protein Y032_0211g2183 [Ancylostoma ceylanicum]|uniref:Peptidase M20 dimerisation domain-containing protein n=1 Tax=Ancylostoma ceylanicum TaxID=53326 RepID=A0A016SJX7_9BILA|nr:hypothetical protein Y032_0211g2183 [Ancylostoma ceylanicum]